MSAVAMATACVWRHGVSRDGTVRYSLQAEVRKKLEEREEEERRRSRKIKDINRMEEQEKELLLQIYACKMIDTDDIKNNKEKGLQLLNTSFCSKN